MRLREPANQSSETEAMAYQASLGIIALTRFGYGPHGDAVAAVDDPQGVLHDELMEPGIAQLPGDGLTASKEAIQLFYNDRADRKAARERIAAAGPVPMPAAAASSAPVPDAGDTLASSTRSSDKAKPPNTEQVVFRAEALARIRRAVQARVGFVERLVAFWSNHFCISAAKSGFARITAGAFEREAIRPHVLGRFAEMLRAVETHPAMLHYLDNVHSIGPSSRAGQHSARGLNENLGREILELHTLGGGYGQGDVTNLARILTGWTVVGPPGKLGEPGSFAFNGNAHEPGPLALLGNNYDGEGPAQGLAALDALARHPATATHVARKLAQAFVADNPPPALVGRLARTFRDTDGDLRAMALALIAAPESWSRGAGRMRDPYEFLIGTNRLLRRVPDESGAALVALRAMGMALWQPPGPNGFATDAGTWASPEALKLRLDHAAAVSQHLREPPDPAALLDMLCGGRTSDATRDAVARAESRAQGIALVLMSPEMQRI